MDEDNPCVSYARLHGVDVEALHQKIQDGIDSAVGEPLTTFTDDELCVLKACVEVACGF